MTSVQISAERRGSRIVEPDISRWNPSNYYDSQLAVGTVDLLSMSSFEALLDTGPVGFEPTTLSFLLREAAGLHPDVDALIRIWGKRGRPVPAFPLTEV